LFYHLKKDLFPAVYWSYMFSDNYKKFLRAFFEAHTSTFEANSVGWIHSTWKTESAAESSYSAGLAGGWIPSDVTQRAYPNVCSGASFLNTTVPIVNVTTPVVNATTLIRCGRVVPRDAKGVTINMRIEGMTRTLYEGPLFTTVHNFTLITENGILNDTRCDGAGYQADATPYTTVISAIDDASCDANLNWTGIKFDDIDSYSVSMSTIGPADQNGNTGWSAFLSGILVGGPCETATKEGDELVVFARKSMSQPYSWLKLEGSTTGTVGQPVRLKITDRKNSSPAGGAVVKGLDDATVTGTAGSDGTVSLTFDQAGTYNVKAEKGGAVRSNKLTIIVTAAPS
ncbi:hypothetical protein MPER_12045, partial [Moniliophthora perniciosa FA553]